MKINDRKVWPCLHAHLGAWVRPLGTSILVSCSPESSCLSRAHVWTEAPSHHPQPGCALGEGTGDRPVVCLGDRGMRVRAQEAAQQPESHRAEPAPLVPGGSWDPHPVSSSEAEGPVTPGRRPWRARVVVAPSPKPQAWRGEDSILRPPKLRLNGSAVEKGSFPIVGGSRLSGVLDVPDVPEGRLVHDAAHLLQTLCLADLFQAHLQGLGQSYKISLHLFTGLQFGLQPQHLCPLF